MPRRFEIAVGAVIRVVYSIMFHRWKANDVVHDKIFGDSGRDHVRMASVKVADQERQCKTGQVLLQFLQSISRITLCDWRLLVDAMLPRTSVRSQFQFVASFYNSLKARCRYSVWRSFFFVAHPMTSLQFVFASVRLQCAASCRSVVKDSQFFCSNKPFCLVCSSVCSTQTLCGLHCVNVQHLFCLQSCLNFVCHCLFRHFVLCAGPANRALLIDVHVFCISLQTNTDS